MEKETPIDSGYFMPAEWEKHDATWISWPTNPLSFPERILSGVEETYCRMASALSSGEKVHVLVNDAQSEQRASRLLSKHDFLERNVRFHRIRSADVWIRDYGPTFLLNRRTGRKAAVKWDYNAYGGKYDDLLYDDVTGAEVLKASGVKAFKPGIVLEGGSIEVDGAGTLLTTEQCLLNKNRNPYLSRAQIEDYLHKYTGASRVIWLKSGIDGDDTDGHVDDFARFAAKGKVLCAHGAPGRDGKVLQQNLGILENSADATGAGLEVIKLPMPAPIVDEGENRQLPASYANFYIANKAVLLPVFGDKKDKEAAQILEGVFPGREIVQIMARGLVFGYGGIHCATQQEPAETARSGESF
jgi:agmatine deiminase